MTQEQPNAPWLVTVKCTAQVRERWIVSAPDEPSAEEALDLLEHGRVRFAYDAVVGDEREREVVDVTAYADADHQLGQESEARQRDAFYRWIGTRSLRPLPYATFAAGYTAGFVDRYHDVAEAELEVRAAAADGALAAVDNMAVAQASAIRAIAEEDDVPQRLRYLLLGVADTVEGIARGHARGGEPTDDEGGRDG